MVLLGCGLVLVCVVLGLVLFELVWFWFASVGSVRVGSGRVESGDFLFLFGLVAVLCCGLVWFGLVVAGH